MLDVFAVGAAVEIRIIMIFRSRLSDSQQSVKYVIKALTSRYAFLWLDDARKNFAEILEHDGPQGALHAVNRETERLIVIEKEISALPQTFSIGAVCLYMQPVRETLVGLALGWKNLYTSALLKQAQVWWRSQTASQMIFFVSAVAM